jgi:hypothetical protein
MPHQLLPFQFLSSPVALVKDYFTATPQSSPPSSITPCAHFNAATTYDAYAWLVLLFT